MPISTDSARSTAPAWGVASVTASRSPASSTQNERLEVTVHGPFDEDEEDEHIWTRRYMNLDQQGRAYQFRASEQGSHYVPVELAAAIRRASAF